MGTVPTVMRDDGPGHGRGVDAADHPEHAEPAQVLTPLLSGQNLSKVGEHDGNGTSNPAGYREDVKSGPAHSCEIQRAESKLALNTCSISIPAYQRVCIFYYFITLILYSPCIIQVCHPSNTSNLQ